MGERDRTPLHLVVVIALLALPSSLTAQAGDIAWQRIAPPSDLYFNGSSGRLNVRAGPGLDQPVIDSLPVGAVATIRICEPDAGWCVIQYGNGMRVGWLRSELLTRIDGDAVTAPSVTELLQSARREALSQTRPLPRPDR